MTNPSIHILRNAKIYTGDAGHPWAESLAIVDGKIAGLDADALAWQDAPGVTEADTEDMGGALIIPGLIDSHIHMMWYAQSLRQLQLRDLSRADLHAEVAARAADLPPGEWITGRGWDQNIWADDSFPTREELDRVAPAHPVALTAKSAHALVANSAALRAAGIADETPDLADGKLGRDAHGRPNGMFFENAVPLISRAIPDLPLDTLCDAMTEAQTHLLASGITGIHDVDGEPAFEAFQALHLARRLNIRVTKYVRQETFDAVLGAGLRSGFGDDWLRFGGLKLFADGALGARTAALFDPYEGEPDNTGVLTLTQEQLRDLANRAVAAHIAMAIHAIGDRTNRIVLDVLEEVALRAPDLRHRIEHVQLITPEDQPRLARLGVVAAMQPIHAAHDWQMSNRYWGARSAHAYAWRSVLDTGAILAFGSDAPIEIFDPFAGLYAAVTRRAEDGSPGPNGWYPEQALTLEEALRAYTWGSAYAVQMENRLGRLRPGYHADLIVLDRDVFTLPPEALLETQVQRAMVGGAWRYGA